MTVAIGFLMLTGRLLALILMRYRITSSAQQVGSCMGCQPSGIVRQRSLALSSSPPAPIAAVLPLAGGLGILGALIGAFFVGQKPQQRENGYRRRLTL